MTRTIRLCPLLSIVALLCTSISSFGQYSKQSRILDYFSRKSETINYSIFRGQPAPSKDLLILLEHQAKWDEAASGPTNPLGLRLRFVKVDEPVKQGNPVAMRYRVFADGAPENKVFSIGSWPVSREFLKDSDNIYANAGVSGSQDIYVNGQGLLMTDKPKPEQMRSLRAGNELEVKPRAGRGEPVRYLLDSLDEELQVVGTLVPFPVMAEDQGCRIEARIAQPNATAVLVIVEGFPAKSKVPLVLESEGAVVHEVLTTDLNGHSVIADFPYVPGKARGTLKATAEGKNCLPSVDLPWGAATGSTPKGQ